MTIAEMMKDITIPMRGAITMNAIILVMPLIMIELKPAFAHAAPARPPTRVWEELEGSPNRHVIRFHVIAAERAAAMTVRLMTSGLTTPLPMVVATFNGKITNATKLKKAAKATAVNGERTFVETTVAIEFAES